jgi:hypothetical protein
MDHVVYSYQAPGVIQPDPVEAINIMWDGIRWILVSHKREGIECSKCGELILRADELEYINPKNMITDPFKQHQESCQVIEKELR